MNKFEGYLWFAIALTLAVTASLVGEPLQGVLYLFSALSVVVAMFIALGRLL